MTPKPKILCICAKGKNRSKYLARYLKSKGYKTKYGGIDEGGDFREKIQKPATKKDIDWAEVIIIVRKRLLKIFKKKFKINNRRIIILDVTDSRRLIPKRFAYLKEASNTKFQKTWTQPQLRKAIKPYLPIKLKK